MLNIKEPYSIELRDREAIAPDGSSVSIEDIAMEAFRLEDHEQIMGTASYVSPECPAPLRSTVCRNRNGHRYRPGDDYQTCYGS